MADKTHPLIAELIESIDDPVVAALISSMDPLELLRVAPMPEAEHLSSLSSDSIQRNHPDKILELGPRRRAVRVIHALMLRPSRNSAA
jgi:hypothetical protein